MEKALKKIARINSLVCGSLDGLELDNTSEVIEKSIVIELLNDIKKLTDEARAELLNKKPTK